MQFHTESLEQDDADAEPDQPEEDQNKTSAGPKLKKHVHKIMTGTQRQQAASDSNPNSSCEQKAYPTFKCPASLGKKIRQALQAEGQQQAHVGRTCGEPPERGYPSKLPPSLQDLNSFVRLRTESPAFITQGGSHGRREGRRYSRSGSYSQIHPDQLQHTRCHGTSGDRPYVKTAVACLPGFGQ